MFVLRHMPKNTSNDGSFILDDFEFAGLAGNRSIPVGASPSMSTIAYHTRHATADLLRSVLTLHLSDKAEKPN